ncbi:LD-carboxypeptidase [uncultured Eubacterium sp.]|nr:LD-carboxypeptidase [uncultured Eubacterium sp.]
MQLLFFKHALAQIVTYFAQLEQLGVFKKVKGILLGTFTQMEREQPVPAVYSLLKRYINEELPVVKTEYIGHGEDSKAIQIGKKYKF